jgi:hypothetical protein
MSGICVSSASRCLEQLGHTFDQRLPFDVPPRRVMIAPDLKQVANLVA